MLSFEPSESNLPQLASFPTLIDNIVAWSQRLAPQTAAAGTPFALRSRPAPAPRPSNRPRRNGEGEDLEVAPGGEVPVSIARPGNYVLTLTGPWGTRRLAVAVNPADAPPPAPRSTSARPPRGAHRPQRLVALGAGGGARRLLLEALYAWWREPDALSRPGGRSPRACRWRASCSSRSPSSTRPPAPRRRRPRSSSTARSASAPPRPRPRAAGWRAEGCGDDCHVVQFGGGAEVTGVGVGPLASAAGGSSGPRNQPAGSARTGARPDPARRPRRPPQRRSQTSGEPLRLAAAARRRGITVDTVALTDQPADAALTRLQVPPALHAGDPLSVEVTVRSTVASPAVLTVRRDGKRSAIRR